MAEPQSSSQVRDIASAMQAIDRNVSYDIKKLIEDDKIKELLSECGLSGLYPFISYLNGLTYLPDDNIIYARKAYAEGHLLIEECFTAESDIKKIQLVNSIRFFIDTQIYDSRKGFKATVITENRSRIDVQGLAQAQPKKKFLGIF